MSNLSDEQVLAKVRQAAERTIEAHEYAQESHRSAATLARVALAMVAEYDRAVHVDNQHAASRILSALRAAVGE